MCIWRFLQLGIPTGAGTGSRDLVEVYEIVDDDFRVPSAEV